MVDLREMICEFVRDFRDKLKPKSFLLIPLLHIAKGGRESTLSRLFGGQLWEKKSQDLVAMRDHSKHGMSPPYLKNPNIKKKVVGFWGSKFLYREIYQPTLSCENVRSNHSSSLRSSLGLSSCAYWKVPSFEDSCSSSYHLCGFLVLLSYLTWDQMKKTFPTRLRQSRQWRTCSLSISTRTNPAQKQRGWLWATTSHHFSCVCTHTREKGGGGGERVERLL